MNRSLFRITVFVQIGITILMSIGCAPTQPFFLNESPDLQYYLDSAARIEFPDVNVESLAETTQALPPLTIGNHDYQFWDLTLEECVAIALGNSKYFATTGGNAEFRQNIAAQFVSGTADQFGSVYDTALQQSTTQSGPLTIDGNGNRLLPRNVIRANQVGGVEDALAEFDAQSSGFFNFATTDRPQNVGIANIINPSETQARNITQQFAISKRNATGAVTTFRQGIAYTKNNTPISINSRQVESDYTTTIEAEWEQPLLRNRGTLINRIPVVLASLNEDISIADFEVQVRNLVRDVEVAYWDLYIAYRNVATTTIARNSAIATAQFARANLEAGTGTVQELAQAEEQYYQFRASLEGALAGSNLPGDDRFGVYGRERALRELIGLSATDGRLVRPIEEPSIARVTFDWDQSIAQMLYLSPELRTSKFRIKQSELELISAKNQILWDVNLALLYRWLGVGDTFGPPNRSNIPEVAPGSSSLASLTSGDYQEGSVRLEITPPAIGSRRELARIRNAQLRLAQNKAFLQESERLLVSQFSDAIAKAATHYRLMETQAQRWQAAERETETRLAEFEAGRSPVNVVLQSQQRKAQAQISYYRAVAEYNKSLNYVNYLKGTMLANSGITLREGPWNSKAYCDALERARERSAGKELQYGVTRPNVVRTGPVRDEAGALHVMQKQKPGIGQHGGVQMTAGDMSTIGPPVEFLNDPQSQMQLDPLSSPTPAIIDSEPLSEMGTPYEMFSPEPAQRQMDQLVPQDIQTIQPSLNAPSPSLPTEAGDSILVPPAADSTPSQAIPLPGEVRSRVSPDAPIGNGVAKTSFEASVSDQDHSPAPVRRRPLP